MFALLNRFSLFRLRVRKDKCKSCNLCAKTCPVDNKVYCSPSSDDCIRCLECVDSCKRGGVKAGLISVLPREDYWE
jgi:polyferredoxin